jgi:hypothetical protein
MPLDRRQIDYDSVGAIERECSQIHRIGQLDDKTGAIGMIANPRAHNDRLKSDALAGGTTQGGRLFGGLIRAQHVGDDVVHRFWLALGRIGRPGSDCA